MAGRDRFSIYGIVFAGDWVDETVDVAASGYKAAEEQIYE